MASLASRKELSAGRRPIGRNGLHASMTDDVRDFLRAFWTAHRYFPRWVTLPAAVCMSRVPILSPAFATLISFSLA